MSAWGEIARRLNGLQRKYRQVQMEVFIYVLVGSAALVLAVAFLGAHWQSALFVWLWLLLALVGVGVFMFWFWWRFWRPSGSLLHIAQTAELLAPELGTALRSAVDFSTSQRERETNLVEHHFRRTVQELEQTDLESRCRQNNLPYLRLGKIFLGASIVCCFLVTALAGDSFSNLRRILSPGENEAVSAEPITGNLQVLYKFPAYTQLPPRQISGSDGNLQALHASEVELEGLSQFPLKEALVRFWDVGASQSRDVPAVVVGERGFKASFSLLYSGHYSFVLTNEDGERIIESREHRINVIPDAYPTISLESPAKDIEIKDDESIRITWSAKDDFALSEVALVIDRKDGQEVNRIVIHKPRGNGGVLKGRYKLAASELALGKESEATIYLEVSDNDVINGPKKSVSVARNVKLFSARAQHEALLNAQGELLDAMVDGLAGELLGMDSLPAVESAGKARQQQQSLMEVLSGLREQVETLLGDLRKDKLSAPEQRAALNNISQRLRASISARSQAIKLLRKQRPNFKEGVKQVYAKIIATLETDIIYLDDLLALRRVESLKDTAQDLLAAQRELRGLINEYRETQDPSLQAELSQRIADLRAKMLDLLSRMASIRKGLPGEYRNLEAARGVEMNMQLRELENLLAQGDLEAAAAELEELANMVENMVDSIAQAEEDFGEDRYADIRDKLNQFSQDFSELEAMQSQIADEGATLLDKKRREAVEALADDLDDLIIQLRKKVDEVLLDMDTLVEVVERTKSDSSFVKLRQRVLDLGVLIENRDFAEAKNIGREAELSFESFDRLLMVRQQRFEQKLQAEEKKSIESIDQGIKEINEKLEKLFPDASALNPAEKKEVKEMAEEQGEISKAAEKLESMMEELGMEAPIFGAEQRSAFKAAQQAMQNANKSLQSEELGQATKHGQMAAEELAKLRRSLEGAGEQKRGLPMPMNFGMPRNRNQLSGAGGARHEEVEIPQGMTELSERKFREKLLEAAKQKAPKRYEKAVQDYYQELIK
ncbi:MAG: hypothetical protein CMH60_02085 [Myxococcales bacterium]|nr:hypothetical protein [Myxococcales bacterium]